MSSSDPSTTPESPMKFFFLLSLLSGPAWAAASFDVVICGGTPSGVAAATNAGREGVSVALVEETHQVGGLTAGGLAHTDFKTFESLSGSWKEFMDRVQEHYKTTYGEGSQPHLDCARGGYYEPHVARKVFEEMLESAGVTVFLNHQLVSTTRSGDRVTSATFVPADSSKGYPLPKEEPSITLNGSVFIDATYEGDLLAAADVPFRLGTDARSDFNESLAPVEGNDFIMATNFRVCLSRDPANRLPIPKPDNYNREDYALVIDLLADGTVTRKHIGGPPWRLDDLIRVRPVPNLKSDFNDKMGSPISIKLIEETHAWPDATPAERAEIFDTARNRALGLFWFLGNDPELPDWVRDDMNLWGLPADEFTESGHWTPVLYIREGRRLKGVRVFTQHDTERTGGPRAKLNRDAIAIGDYSINSHGTHHLPDGSIGGVLRQGGPPFQIPYGVLVPESVDGLLASVPISASHVGYSALRMEPAWTAMGQAAGLAAAYAVKNDLEVRDVPVRILQNILHGRGAFTIYTADVPAISPYFEVVQFFGTHGFFHELSDSGSAPGFFEGPPVQIACQWSNRPKGGHAVLPEKEMTPELARSWLARYKDLFPERPLDLSRFDETLTRGEFLARMADPASVDPSAPAIVPPATLGELYTHMPLAQAPLEPTIWTHADGNLPPGVKLENGILCGTPVETGEYSFTLETEQGDEPVRREFQMTVGPRP